MSTWIHKLVNAQKPKLKTHTCDRAVKAWKYSSWFILHQIREIGLDILAHWTSWTSVSSLIIFKIPNPPHKTNMIKPTKRGKRKKESHLHLQMGHVNNLSCQIKNSMCFNIIGPSDLSRGSTHPWACELYHLHAEISEQQCEISSSKYMINHDNIIIYIIYIYIFTDVAYMEKNTCSTFKRSQFYESGSQVSRTLNFIKKSLNQNHFKYPWQLLYETTDLPPKKKGALATLGKQSLLKKNM